MRRWRVNYLARKISKKKWITQISVNLGDWQLAIGYWRWDFKERIILPIELISTSNISRISLDM